MSEIKSALELALERTRGLRASDEEKLHWEEERLARQARALATVIREPGAKTEEARTRIRQTPETERARLIEMALAAVLDESSPDDDGEILVRALEVLRDRDPAAVRNAMAALGLSLEEEKRRRALAITAESRKELEERGIRGSAVVPNAQASAAWRTIEEDLAGEWRRRVLALA